jgi:hypothetical protein
MYVANLSGHFGDQSHAPQPPEVDPPPPDSIPDPNSSERITGSGWRPARHKCTGAVNPGHRTANR